MSDFNRKYFSLENVAIAMHCNLKPLDVAPVLMGINYEEHNALAYKLTITPLPLKFTFQVVSAHHCEYVQFESRPP